MILILLPTKKKNICEPLLPTELSLADVSSGCIAKVGFKVRPDVCNSSVTLYWITSNCTGVGEGVYSRRGEKKTMFRGHGVEKHFSVPSALANEKAPHSHGETRQLLISFCIETGPQEL